MVIKASNTKFNSGATQRVSYTEDKLLVRLSPSEPTSLVVTRATYHDDHLAPGLSCCTRFNRRCFKSLKEDAPLSFKMLNNFTNAEACLIFWLTLDEQTLRHKTLCWKGPQRHYGISKDLSVFRTCKEMFENRRSCTLDKANAWKIMERIEYLQNSMCFTSSILRFADVVITKHSPSISTWRRQEKNWSAYDSHVLTTCHHNQKIPENDVVAPTIPCEKRSSPRGVQRPAMWKKSTPSKLKRKTKNTRHSDRADEMDRPKEIIHINMLTPQKYDSRDLNVNIVVKKLGHQSYNAPRRSSNKRKSIRQKVRNSFFEDMREGQDMLEKVEENQSLDFMEHDTDSFRTILGSEFPGTGDDDTKRIMFDECYQASPTRECSFNILDYLGACSNHKRRLDLLQPKQTNEERDHVDTKTNCADFTQRLNDSYGVIHSPEADESIDFGKTTSGISVVSHKVAGDFEYIMSGDGRIMDEKLSFTNSESESDSDWELV